MQLYLASPFSSSFARNIGSTSPHVSSPDSVIGAIAVGVLASAIKISSASSTGSVDGVPTIINGVPTLAGWLNYVELLVCLFGAFGALSGFVFWCVLKWSGNLPGKGKRPSRRTTISDLKDQPWSKYRRSSARDFARWDRISRPQFVIKIGLATICSAMGEPPSTLSSTST